MIFGLLGMILSVWSMMASFILIDYKIELTISTCALCISILALGFSYILFSSALTTLYVQLPEDKMSFSGVKFYVVFFAVVHVGIAVAAVYLSKSWPICLLLIVSSFIFCCDGWSCIFTDRYMLSLHRERKFETRTVYPTDWVIHRVAVKRFSKQICPEGFQFDEDLFNEDEDLWIRYDHSVESNSFWV
ncbi:hypothetical protein CAEBREN_15084 [Caenorhabditis brenneri]|uniref:Transmembrane protein n=1 Tax=Caenorhabditis brenneri TaxID=135651 RepID=G0NIM2_CAEBE|nr:hypothetical protein CAEBREN_15084 [Caenorhabditis brenneri]